MHARGQGTSRPPPSLDLSIYVERALNAKAGNTTGTRTKKQKSASRGQGHQQSQEQKGSSNAAWKPKTQAQLQHQQGAALAAAGAARNGETWAGPASAATSAANAQQKPQLQAQRTPLQQQSPIAPASPPPPPSMAGKLNAQQQAELVLQEARHPAQQQAQRAPTPQQHEVEQPVSPAFGQSWPTSPWLPHLAATGTPRHQIASPSTPCVTSAPFPGMPRHVPSPLQSVSSSASAVTPQPSRPQMQQASNHPTFLSTPYPSGPTQAAPDASVQSPPVPMMSMPPVGMFGPPMYHGSPLPMTSMPLRPYPQPYGQHQGQPGAYPPLPFQLAPAYPSIAQPAATPFGGASPPPAVLQRQALWFLEMLHSQIVRSNHVSSCYMIRKLCEHWKCTQTKAKEMMCLDDWYSLPYLKTLREWEEDVDNAIAGYEMRYLFAATLSNLAQHIDVAEDAKEGEVESWLGPLLYHPRVQKFLEPHPLLHEIPKVTLPDCLTALQNVQARNRRVQIRAEDIIEELMKMHQVQNASKLCVRIRQADIGKAITMLCKSGDIESASFEIQSEDYQKGNTPQAFQDSQTFGLRDKAHRLLPLSHWQDPKDTGATLDAAGSNGAPTVRVQYTGQNFASELSTASGTLQHAEGRVSHTTSPAQQQTAGASTRQLETDSISPPSQQRASGTSTSATSAAPMTEAATEDAEGAAEGLSESLTERVRESAGKAEYGASDQIGDATSVKELADYVKTELRKARAADDGTKTSTDSLVALAQIEQRILSNPQVSKGGFGKLTRGACSSMLDLLSMEPDLVKELLPSLQLPAANMEVEGLPAALARQARTPSVLLLCAVKQAADAWEAADAGNRAADHTQQQIQQQRAKAKEEAVAACLCAQFGVRSVEELGFGSAAHLLSDESGDMHSDVLAACALACGAGGAAVQQQPLAVLGVEERHLQDTAVATLQAAPYFVDLEEWCQWDLAFGSCFGPLAGSDILHEAAKRSVWSKDARWCALVLPGGHVLKLPHVNGQMELLEALGHKVQQLDAAAAVQDVLSLVAFKGSCSVAVVQLLKGHVLSAMRTALAQAEGNQDMTKLQRLCDFALNCLKHLPRPVCPLLAPVFLDTVPEVLGVTHADAQGQMLDCAVTAEKDKNSGSQVQVLIHLGLALGVPAWLELYRKIMRTADKQSQTQPQQTEAQGPERFMTQLQEMDAADGFQIQPDSEVQDLVSSSEKQDAIPVAPPQAVQAVAMLDPIPPMEVEEAKKHVYNIRRQWGRDGAVVTAPDSRFNDESVILAMQALGIKQNTDNSHFMLEIVQNADDNTYAENTTPWIGFEICEDSIHVANNEVGFSKKSMDKICELCGSEKRADQVKTGNKGIGFKSVFKVTRAAHVQSNAYRVKFDVDADPLGYLVPQWLETPMPLGLWQECRTHLVLPLLNELRNSINGVKLRDRLREAFAPKLLVFLKKLKMLTMVDRVKEERIELQRSSSGNDRVEVTRRVYSLASNTHVPISQETASFLMVTEEKQLEPPILRREGMPPCKSRSMQLAFQLPSHGSSSKDDPERQLVYAYLPMKHYGLRFLLNADFETTTNREAIDEGNMYNQKTLELFPFLVTRALEKLKKQEFPPGRKFSGLDWWLKCLPREPEVVDNTFSVPIAQLTGLLQRTPCIPTEHGGLVMPSQAAVCTDPAVTDLLDKLRPRFVKEHLIHRNCTAMYDGDRAKQLQQQLGVHRFSAEQLPSFAREVARHPEVLDSLGTGWVAQLLLCVLCMPISMGRAKAMDDLRTLPLLKLYGVESKYAAASGVERSDLPRLHQLPSASRLPLPLFFPLGHSEAKGLLHAQLVEAGGAFAPERLPLPQLDPVLLQQVGGQDSTVTAHHLRQRLRDEMGVQEMTAQDVLDLYVLPLFHWHKQQLRQRTELQPSQTQQQQEDEDLIAALRFVVLSKRLLDEEVLKKVKECAVVVVVDSKGCSKRCCMSPEAPVYIPQQLGNDIDLASDFPSYNWSMLSVKYALGGHTAGADSSSLSISPAQWRDALLALGAHTWLPIIQPLPRALSSSELQACAVARSHSQLGSAYDGGISRGNGDVYVLEDAECPAFEDLVHAIHTVGSVPLRTQQMLKLQWQMADHLQHTKYRNALRAKAHVSSKTGESSKQYDMDNSIAVRTSFALSLRNLPWLLNNKTGQEVPMVPRKLFTAKFKPYLFDKVDYVHSQTREELLRFGVNQEPTLDLMLDVLKSWAGHETGQDCGNDWFSSVHEMDTIYNFILQEALRGGHETEERVWNAFKEFPLLWMPQKKDWPDFKIPNLTLSVMGKFYHTRVTRRWDNANAMEAIDWDKQHIRILGLYYKTWKGKGNKKGALFRTPLYHHEFDAASYNEDVEEEDCCDDEDGGSAEETSAQQQNTLSEGKRCLVADYPSTEEYVAALEVLQERNPKRSSREDNKFASGIFKRLWEDWLLMGKVKPEELREHLHTARNVFPTTTGWSSWQDAIFWNDDESLATKLVEMKLPVKFLAMPDVPTFFEAVWMPTLKRSIAPAGLKRGVPVAQGKVEATALCKKALACMQRILYYQKDQIRMYSMLSELGISQVLPYLTVELLEEFPVLNMVLLGPSGPIDTTCTLRQDAALVFGQSTVCLYLKASPGKIFDTGSAARELSRLFSDEVIGQLAEGAALRRYPLHNLELQHRLAELLKQQDMERLMQKKGLPQLPDGELSWLDNVTGKGPFANPPAVPEAAALPRDPPTDGNAVDNGSAAVDQDAPAAGRVVTTTSSKAASSSTGSITQAAAVVPRSGAAEGKPVPVPSVTLAPRDANRVLSAKWKLAEVRARAAEKDRERQKKREERLRQQQEGQLQEERWPPGNPQAGVSSKQVHHYSVDEVRRAMSEAVLKSRQTGMRGEVMVVQELIKSKRGFKVKWLDEDGSTMKAYDIEVEPAMDEEARAAGAKCSLVEVKSTALIPGGCVEFELSPNQFKAALEHGAAYEVFLVRGAQSKSPDMIQLSNPAALWKQGGIRMKTGVQFFVDSCLAKEKRF